MSCVTACHRDLDFLAHSSLNYHPTRAPFQRDLETLNFFHACSTTLTNSQHLTTVPHDSYRTASTFPEADIRRKNERIWSPAHFELDLLWGTNTQDLH